MSRTCIIVYTIDEQEGRTTVKSESDWEILLNQFCDYAQDGKSVTFYNLSSQPSDLYSGKSLMGSKEGNTPTTITTSNREEIKAWMRKMEQEGKTVNVTYNRLTGVWSGTAYTNAPIVDEETTCYNGVVEYVNMPAFDSIQLPGVVLALRINEDTTFILVRNNSTLITVDELEGYSLGDTATLCGIVETGTDYYGNPLFILDISTTIPASVVGTWLFSCLTEYAPGDGHSHLNTITQYIPEENGNSIYFNFQSDGTATRIVGTGSSLSVNGNWELTDTQFCCDLPDLSGDCWNVVWFSTTTIIISRTEIDEQNRAFVYQILLEKDSQ